MRHPQASDLPLVRLGRQLVSRPPHDSTPSQSKNNRLTVMPLPVTPPLGDLAITRLTSTESVSYQGIIQLWTPKVQTMQPAF